MVIEAFPSVEDADEYGLLAMGGDLEVESLLLAYRSGIFPWPVFDKRVITWFAPPERTVLFLKDFKIPKSVQKLRAANKFSFAIDKNCPEVIRRCAASKTRREKGSWITSRMIEGYINLHHAGYCHSVECYEGDELVGGLYGVSIGGTFAGESMFYDRSGASKLSLCYLVEHLQERGATWIDCQQMTPLLASFGAVEISRDEFMQLLPTALGNKALF